MEHKITALRIQKRNPNRVNVYLDGQFAFGLSRIVAAWLQVGQTIDDEKISALRVQEKREATYQAALRLLNFRPRTEAELRAKLAEKGFEQGLVNEVIQRLKEEGWVADERFARAWVESRALGRPRGRRLIALELKRKGISEEIIEEAVADVSDADLAYQAGKRYVRRLKDVDYATFYKRLASYLQRRGFYYSTIAETIQRIWQEHKATDTDT
jgi:regulatory protein